MILTILKTNYNLNSFNSQVYNFLFYKKIWKFFLFKLPFFLYINSFITIIFLKKNLKIFFTKFCNIRQLDTIQKFNFLIKIYIPIKIIYKNKFYFSNLFLLEIPYISKENLIILNGIKRIFIEKLYTFNYISLLIFKKETYKIIILKLHFFELFFDLNISYDFKKNKLILFSNKLKFKINYILFLYLIGFSTKMLKCISAYGNTLFFLSLLKEESFNNINYEKLFFIIKILKKNFISKKLNYFLYLIDFLFDIKFNKKILKKQNYIQTKKITNLFSYLEVYIDNILKKIWKNLTNIQNDKYFKNNILYINSFYLSYQEKLLINPQLRFLDDINIISEISYYYKIINYTSKNCNISNKNLNYLRDIYLDYLGIFSLLETNEGNLCGFILALISNVYIDLNEEIYFFLLKKNNTMKFLFTLLNFKEKNNIKIGLDKLGIKKEVSFFSTLSLSLTNLTFKIEKNKNIFFYLTPDNFLSISESLIPFIFYTDSTRSLMGSKMQSQALSSFIKKKSYLLTGQEFIIPYKYVGNLYSFQEGIVTYVSSYKIQIRDFFNRHINYYLITYKNSNQNVMKYEKPLVWVGERIFWGQLLAINQDFNFSELSLGNPCLILYGSYFGYDYEDSLIISQNLMYNHIFSSLHFFICELSFSYLNTMEYSTLKIPNTTIDLQKNLDKVGIIKEGSYVSDKTVLISKIIKKVASYNFSFKYLINNLFGDFIYFIKDESIKSSEENTGRIIKTEVYIKNSLNYTKYLVIRIFIGKIKIINLGDKLCGRHGNKGIVSYIINSIDMPYTNEGIVPDIITGCLGIPSRMNISQLFEGLLGLSGYYLNNRYCITYNLEALYGINYLKLFIYSKLNNTSILTSFKKIYNSYIPGKISVKDGRTGETLNGSCCFGIVQFFKLIHMSKNKISYRTIGPYSEISQQPFKGKSRKGGQRFGEMEVWALEAFGNTYTLKELLDFRSDDLIAREEFFNMINYGFDYIKKSTISETFKIIYKELQSLSLNINNIIIYPTLNSTMYNINIF